MVPSSAALGFLSLPLALLAFAPAGSPTSTAPAQERDQGKKERKEGEEKPEPTLKVGDAAPAIEVDKWVKGDAVSGFEKGKAYLVEFWATWCPPCREEMPAMERLYTRQKNRGLAMVAVSLDASPAVVAPYLAQGGFTFPVALDPRMDLANAYGVRVLPASFIVDPRGVVVAMALGPREWDGPAASALVEGVAR